MRNIRLTIEYDGTDYCGWQRQKNGLSIQEVIEKTLKKILRENIKVTGAGRTDSGVHARGQVANFKTSSDLALKNIYRALNTNLPNDICARNIRTVHSGFNAQFDAKSKMYRYAIYAGGKISPFVKKYAVPIPYGLDIAAMQKASKYLLGRHDFSSFMSLHSSAKTAVRTIKNISVTRKGSWVFVNVEADGFLYNMVRAIVGTLLDIGRGALEAPSMKKVLSAKNRSSAGPTAPAKGLALVKVKY